jgi:hypothetical protein
MGYLRNEEKGSESPPRRYFFCTEDPLLATGNRSHLRYVIPGRWANIKPVGPNGVDPDDYVRFARSDLQSGMKKDTISAVGHAKRAIHLSVDSLLELIGLSDLTEAGFDLKTDILQEVNAFPIKLISDLNKRRNSIEHEYEVIKREKAENLVDVADMFVRVSSPILNSIVCGAGVGIEDDERNIEWRMNYTEEVLEIRKLDGSPYDFFEGIGKMYYTYEQFDEEYYEPPKSKEEAIAISGLDEDGRSVKPDAEVVRRVQMEKENVEEWAPIIDTFLYCTRRQVYYGEGESTYFSRSTHNPDKRGIRVREGWYTVAG